MRVGTPPVVQMTLLETALDIFDRVDMAEVRKQSVRLCEQFIGLVEESCPQLRLFSPRDPAQRGSQVSFRAENGYAIMQALIAEGVIGDFRAPDVMRFGFCPLYIRETDVEEAVGILARILRGALWDRPEFLRRKAVT